MKEYLPYNVLMVIAVAAVCLTLFYNLVLRENFSVFVRYEMPAVPEPEQAEVIAVDVSKEEPGETGGTEYPQAAENGESVLTSVTFPIDVNEATEEQLLFIPQVGSVTAQRIVQYREILGGYTSLEQLMEIKGISEKAYENISAYLIIN